MEKPSMAISVRVRHLPAGKYGGQRRHDLRLGPQPDYVDPERSPDNRILVEPPSVAEMRRITLRRRNLGRPMRLMRSDAAIATTAIITFGKGVQPLISGADIARQDAAYRAVADAICRRHDVGLRGLVVHADEAAPHAHATFDCRSGDGRAVSRQLRGGELQDLAAAAIRPHFPEVTRGVRRAIRKEAGEPKSKWVHRSVRRLHQDLPAEIAGLEALRTAAGDALKAARKREAEMEARVRKLEEREAGLEEGLTAKEAKRLETYRKRLGDRREKLRETKEELTGVEAQLKTAEAARDAARKETRALTDRPLSGTGLLTGGLRQKERDIESRAIREEARRAAAHQLREQALEKGFATRTQELETEADTREGELDGRAAELDRREAAIGEAAEELVGRTATAVQVIAEELVVPYPDPGDWRKGPRFDQDRWDSVGPTIGNRGGRWPARIWGRLRDLHTQVRAALDAAADRIAALTAERDAATGKVAALGADLIEVGTAKDAAERERNTAKAELATALPAAEAGELRATSAHRLLILGASGGNQGMIDQAIGEGVDLDRQLEHGRRMTALHAAVVWARPAAVRQLLKAGADASVKDAQGQTPADMARTMEGKATGPARRKLLREIIEALDPPEPERDRSPGFPP